MAKHQTKAVFLFAHGENGEGELELQIPKPGAAKEMTFANPEELPLLWRTIVASKRGMRASSLFMPIGADDAVEAEQKRKSKKSGKEYGWLFAPAQIKAHAKQNPVAFVLSYGNFSQPRLDVHLTERNGRSGPSAQASTTLTRAAATDSEKEKRQKANEALARVGRAPLDEVEDDD